jgi:hypothetical protein
MRWKKPDLTEIHHAWKTADFQRMSFASRNRLISFPSFNVYIGVSANADDATVDAIN